ncbi:MAG: hypothetical protein WBG71_05335 [Leeuwenhoekiella sp.]
MLTKASGKARFALFVRLMISSSGISFRRIAEIHSSNIVELHLGANN